MNKENLIKEFTNAVADMRRTHNNNTYYWILGEDENNNDWAIVLGRSGGFEEDENDDCIDGTYRICTKVAYQPNNSIMQCDYDIDWLMPYNEESGDVDDTEISIYPDTNLKKVVEWLLECYSSYKE